MLDRTHVAPFLRISANTVQVEFLRDPDGRAVAFLDRLLRLVRHLEGRERRIVSDALRRQERRVRDAGRLAGIAKTLLDACEFRAPAGAERAAEVRAALFAARGADWPPRPGDERVPYETAGLLLHLSGDDIARLLYADAPAARVLVRAPRIDGRTLLDRYNTNLARGVLLDATSATFTARGGWRGIFRAVKLARLMYTLERAGRTRRSWRLTLTGPAAAFLARPQRYGARFARVVPALTRAPGWKLEADVLHQGRTLHYTLDADTLPVPRRRGRPRYDSRFEHALAAGFAAKLGRERDGWTLAREDTPIAIGETLFLPDFTARHRDGREALIEIVGFWTPEYLEDKLRRLRAAPAANLVLVVYRGLDTGGKTGTALAAATAAPVVWFERKPRIGPVMDAVRRVARQDR
jgi:predicted nuclease of restriction endonuclease-like RecB superfamily